MDHVIRAKQKTHAARPTLPGFGMAGPAIALLQASFCSFQDCLAARADLASIVVAFQQGY
ncbi:hypothetical protein AB4Z46_07420 [Variovorax sp. M-6]|uniref:hypothetical protein n=1 Tax=Variovorax sp. M-6 TaxID=3233041 RepID=UPI003F97F87E